MNARVIFRPHRPAALVALVAIGLTLWSAGRAAGEERRTLTLPEWHCTFALPPGWKLAQSQKVGTLQAFTYTRQDQDTNGREISPSFSLIFEKTAEDDAVVFSVKKRLAYGFKVNTVFTHEDGTVRLGNAIGYTGLQTGKDEAGHALVILHAINASQDIGVQCIGEAPSDVMPRLKKEYLQILKSLRFTK